MEEKKPAPTVPMTDFGFSEIIDFHLSSLSFAFMGNTTSTQQAPRNGATPPPGCPMHEQGGDSGINPLNQMPESLSQSPHDSQSRALPTQRTLSSIPRYTKASGQTPPTDKDAPGCPVASTSTTTTNPDADSSSENWVYPSPQQFHHALLRKGKGAPEEHVEMMVQIHNFLNERAWQEVRRWEDKRTG
jgi:cytochrome c heme-lyase